MELRDPIAIYNAANNLEAALVCALLNSSGIEAFAVEDTSVVGQWMFGLLPEIHKPQVWIERANIEAAKPILEKYELEQAGKRQAKNDGAPIEVVCEECNKPSEYPASRLGSIETCVHCGAYVDVDDPSLDEWDESAADEVDG